MRKKIKIPKTNKQFVCCSVTDIVDLELFINRKIHSENSVTGELSLNNRVIGISIEPTSREKCVYVKGVTAIPKGTYEVVVKKNYHYKQELPLVIGIPGFPDTWIVDSERETNEIGIKFTETTKQAFINRLKEVEGKITITIK